MINLHLEISEVEALLKHLSKQAFEDVSALIAKIHGQAVPQVQAIQAAPLAEPAQVEIKEPDISLS
jgi:hypothetical protein